MMKTADGQLSPCSEECRDRLKKIKQGTAVMVDVVVPRNQEFHKKFFAMLNFAYDYWEPEGEAYKGMQPVKDFNRFRHDVIILAGYYDVVVNIKGETRVEAKSISFGNMGEEEFQALYKSAFAVIWQLVLSKIPGMTEEESHNLIAEAESFA